MKRTPEHQIIQLKTKVLDLKQQILNLKSKLASQKEKYEKQIAELKARKPPFLSEEERLKLIARREAALKANQQEP